MKLANEVNRVLEVFNEGKIRRNVIDQLHNNMRRKGIKTDDASPNFVADHAYNMGIKDLTSDEVVHASDTYRK